jgi:hypothetical protein
LVLGHIALHYIENSLLHNLKIRYLHSKHLLTVIGKIANNGFNLFQLFKLELSTRFVLLLQNITLMLSTLFAKSRSSQINLRMDSSPIQSVNVIWFFRKRGHVVLFKKTENRKTKNIFCKCWFVDNYVNAVWRKIRAIKVFLCNAMNQDKRQLF